MKKIFQLKTANKHPDRVLESVKYEIRRYLKRERKKSLPDEATFWDFDCKFGQSSDEAESLSASEIITALDKAKEADWDHCYIEIMAKAVKKKSVPKEEPAIEEDPSSTPEDS